jgi:hypothetical protein
MTHKQITFLGKGGIFHDKFALKEVQLCGEKKNVTKKLIIIVTSPSDVGITNYISQNTVTGIVC